MKIMNFRWASYALLLMALFSLTFTSCSKDDLALEKMNETPLTEEKIPIMLPASLVEQGETAVEDFLDAASKADIIEYRKAYLIANTLEKTGKNKEISIDKSDFDYADLNPADYLEGDDLRTLNAELEKLDNSSERGCTYSYYAVFIWDTCYEWVIIDGRYLLREYRCQKFSHWACCILDCD